MNGAAPGIVYLVDDQPTVRAGIDSLLRSVGYNVRCFESADAFLACERSAQPSCLLLDIRMPGKSGLDLQRLLIERQDDIPIIFLTGHGDVPLCVQAMKAGALDFLLKPFREQTLLDAVQAGIERNRDQQRTSALVADFESLRRTLSPRESEVLALVAEGLSNKEIASRLFLKEITIKVHRASGMRKLQCRSVVDLVMKLNRSNA